MDYSLVDSEETLNSCIKHLLNVDLLGVDLESSSFGGRFNGYLALLQISSREKNFIIDPLVIEDLTPLKEVFASTKIVKIFHNANQDLKVLYRADGIKVVSIFDTLIAAKILKSEKLSFAYLVNKHFEIKLDKSYQRSDWSRRPLSKEQLSYAVGDSLYLIPLFEILHDSLLMEDKFQQAMDQFERLERMSRGYIPNYIKDLRIKASSFMENEELIIFCRLYEFIKSRSIKSSIPIYRLMNMSTLIRIVRSQPLTIKELEEITGINKKTVRSYGEKIIQMIYECKKPQ